MGILGICGSPRSGNTTWIMKKVFKAVSKRGIENELILLNTANIQHCNGCLTCETTEKCPLNDDMTRFYVKLERSRQIVIGTPVYFDSIPGLLKDFLDRINTLCVSNRLKGKKVYLLVVGQLRKEEGENSRNKVIDYIRNFCEICNMKFCKAWGISAREPDDASKSEDIQKLCDSIVREVCG